MSITSKVYNGLLLNRIRDPLEKILRVNQGGFCRDCGCVEQMDLLRRILEGVRDQNLPFVGTFVDFPRPLTASLDWSCFLFSAIMGSQTM